MKFKLICSLIFLFAVAIATGIVRIPSSFSLKDSIDNESLQAPVVESVTAIAPNKVNIIWSDDNSYRNGFKLEKSLNQINWYEFTTVGSNITSYTYTFSNAGSCYYRIRTYAFSDYTLSETITPMSNAIVRLSWMDNSDLESNTRVERSIYGGTWKEIGQAYKNVTTYYDTNILIGTQYSYRLRTYEVSSYSNIMFPLYAPTNLEAIDISFNSITVQWDYPNTNSDIIFSIMRSQDMTNWIEVGQVTNGSAPEARMFVDK